jgi:hypothetical protein
METTIYVKRDFLKGKLCFTLPKDEAIQIRIAEVLSKCRDEHNDNVVLTISTPKNKRTLKQNSLFHVYCQKVHEYTGQGIDKETILEMFDYNTKLVWLDEKIIPETIIYSMNEVDYKEYDLS